MRRGRKSEEARKETMVPSKSVPFRSIHYSIPFHSDPIREQGGVQRAKPKVKITKKKERRGGRRGERRK
jgi:hypothetical protein